MITIMFNNYIIRSESDAEFFSKLNSSTQFNELLYKCVVHCIINNKNMSFNLFYENKKYQVKINKGEVTMKHFQKKEWKYLKPPFNQYFKR